jgi:hypothetical protein
MVHYGKVREFRRYFPALSTVSAELSTLPVDNHYKQIRLNSGADFADGKKLFLAANPGDLR